MKVKINLSRCAGHARCMEEAPNVFGYNNQTNLTYLIKGADVEANRKAVDRAIVACPERAISWAVESKADENTASVEK